MATFRGTLVTGETVERKGQEVIRIWPTGYTVPVADVIAELGNCGLDTTAARALGANDAFLRAIKAAAKRRAASVGALNPEEDIILRAVNKADPDKICFQFTHEFKLMSGTANGYNVDALICLDKNTGIVSSPDTALAADIQSAIPKFQGTMTFSDVNRVIDKILDRGLSVCATTRIADGVLYVPDATFGTVDAMKLLDSLQLFAYGSSAGE